MKPQVTALFMLFIVSATPVPAVVYSVGHGDVFENIGDVPWEAINPGDTVLIHWRSEPYREKWVINRSGTASAPIVVRGVPSAIGELPVIDGENATTRLALDYWSEVRGVIKIGGASFPDTEMPEHIIVENLSIRNARPPFSFTDDRGDVQNYASNAAAVFVERGANIILRGCEFTNCGNGLFCANQTTNLTVEYCYIHNNGIEGSIYEHNSYTEAFGITFQFNRYGSLRAGCLGNNLKDRSAGTVIRYNWIENGNRQLDLVESGSPAIYGDSLYRKTFIYGNILVEAEGEGNSQIIHYGGDSGEEARYRKGMLYLHNNTIVSTRSGNTTLMRLSSNDESCDARNNIVFCTAGGGFTAILNSAGTIDLRNNWLPLGWVASHSGLTGSVNDSGNIEGSDPGFMDLSAQDFELTIASLCRDAGTGVSTEIADEHTPVREYVRHLGSRARYTDTAIDIGAFEFNSGTSASEIPEVPEKATISAYPNPFNSAVRIAIEAPVGAIHELPLRVEIFDITGKSVAKFEGNAINWRPESSLESGIYLVCTSRGVHNANKRIVYLK